MASATQSPLEIWRAQQPTYVKLAEQVASVLREALRRRGIRCHIEYRAKTLDGVVKKMVRKGYSDLSQMGDKAGVRVVCLFEEHRLIAVEVAQECLETLQWDDKKEALRPNEVGYLGVHCQARLRTKEAPLAELECELQFHTVAEHAWSATVHDLLYKPPEGSVIPDAVSRGAYRLAAMMEVYDTQLTRTRKDVLGLPGYRHADILRNLDMHFYRLVDRDYDRGLAAEIMAALDPLLGDDSTEAISGRISSFVDQHETDLKRVFDEHLDPVTEGAALIVQPESIFVFERIDVDEYRLIDAWTKRFDIELLEPYFIAWGRSLH